MYVKFKFMRRKTAVDPSKQLEGINLGNINNETPDRLIDFHRIDEVGNTSDVVY